MTNNIIGKRIRKKPASDQEALKTYVHPYTFTAPQEEDFSWLKRSIFISFLCARYFPYLDYIIATCSAHITSFWCLLLSQCGSFERKRKERKKTRRNWSRKWRTFLNSFFSAMIGEGVRAEDMACRGRNIGSMVIKSWVLLKLWWRRWWWWWWSCRLPIRSKCGSWSSNSNEAPVLGSLSFEF